jgi:hypothetical protein
MNDACGKKRQKGYGSHTCERPATTNTMTFQVFKINQFAQINNKSTIIPL